MKKTASLGALLLALALPLAAQAETVFAGEVTAETAQVIAAPYGGLVEDVRVRVGDSVKIGDPIATVETAKTYASTDGTVSGVFAHEGDSADGVKTQYGALVYIEPINRFTLACSTEKGYNSSENRYIHIGETVFLKCTKDGSHQGRGVVTGLDEKDDGKFTVEVTGGEFYGNTCASAENGNGFACSGTTAADITLKLKAGTDLTNAPFFWNTPSKTACLNIASALPGAMKIAFRSAPAAGTVVAAGANYTLTENDLNNLTSLTEGVRFALVNGQIVTAE